MKKTLSITFKNLEKVTLPQFIHKLVLNDFFILGRKILMTNLPLLCSSK